MSRKMLPASIGTYRIVRPTELTQEQKDILRRAGRERIEARLHELLCDGKVAASQVQSLYTALLGEVGNA